MFIIKIRVKGYLTNLTENQEEKIDTKAIKNSNKITYVQGNTTNKIIIEKDKVILQRENEEFSHEIIFEYNKEHSSEYYLKKYNSSLEFNIITTKFIIEENKININYIVKESETSYSYNLEMSDNL